MENQTKTTLTLNPEEEKQSNTLLEGVPVRKTVQPMAYILLLGPMLEEKHGPMKIIEVIAVTALVTGVINYVFFWNTALCGASGVVFVFILMASFTSFREGEIPITFILVAAIYLGQQVYDGVVLDDNISNMAHVVGGIVGGILGFSLNKRSKYGI